MSTLTADQKRFLEECKLEFSDRFTDADLEYKKIYDLGIPPPPIMYPWLARFNNRDRDRAGGSRHPREMREGNRYRDGYPRDRNFNRGRDRVESLDYNRDSPHRRFRPY